MDEPKIIWTIGHSTREFGEFVKLLKLNAIEVLVDVRHFPGSRRYPHFNKEALGVKLPEYEIEYLHIVELGGRRKARPDTLNTAWRNESFRGYADYMESDGFQEGIGKLLKVASRKNTAIMCSEGVWWRCHRSMISDYLKAKGVRVLHIISDKTPEEHPYTAPAKIIDGELSYHS